MANDINSVIDSFTNILVNKYKHELLAGDVSAILIDMLTNEIVVKEIANIFNRYYDLLQFFIFYFKNIIPDGGVEFSLATVFLNIPGGTYRYVHEPLFHGEYTFKEKLDLSPNYFKGVENIPPRAFSHWNGLNKVILSNDVKIIEDNVFDSCTSLTSIEIPSSVKHIGQGAFYSCASLKNITIPEGITKLRRSTFNGCKSLESVVILGKLSSIDFFAFEFCSKLTSIVMPKSIKIINDYAFQKCISLKTISLPDGLKRIGDGAFMDCKNLTNIVIPDSVIKIGDIAFCRCNCLKSIQLPNKLEKIGFSIFAECSYTLNDVIYNGTKEQWQQIEKEQYLTKRWYSDWALSGKPKEIKCTDGTIEVKIE